MNGRLRDLAGRPLERRVGRATLGVGLAVTVGFCLVVALAGIGRRPGTAPPAHPRPAAVRRATPGPSSLATGAGQASPATGPTPWPRQDPQDRRGSADRRRAAAELESHRALQHVPWRHGNIVVALVGAEGLRAILRVVGPDLAAARRGYRSFLYRFDDRGRAYRPRFRASGGPR
ncbi:MAG: hypothetical protein JSU06_02865 [Actinobacteria bacterium]|nr:hypothetical protein [Actinomycetota bacterium]